MNISAIYSALLREHDRPEDIETEELQNVHHHKLFYQIELRDPLQPEHSVPVEVSHFILKLTPHPKGNLWKEKQLKYTGNIYLSSAYSVIKQTTNVLLTSTNV